MKDLEEKAEDIRYILRTNWVHVQKQMRRRGWSEDEIRAFYEKLKD